MPFKDYYLILGVPRGATQAGIRARYRDLVKSLHPDVAGDTSAEAFRDVSEAYEVLSDPERRRRHNRDLSRRDGRAADSRPAQSPSPPRRRSSRPVSWVDATGAWPLAFEVILQPAEAAHGAVATLRIPMLWTCPTKGRRLEERTIHVRIPPLRRRSAVLETPLYVPGACSRVIRLYVRVAAVRV